MPKRWKARYGLAFPADATDASIEGHCYKIAHLKEAGGLGEEEHFVRYLRLLWPADPVASRRGLVWHHFLDRRARAWCRHSFQTWWGPAATMKSTDMAILALGDWLADPFSTTTILCSTTLQGLQKRLFGELVRYHALLGPGAIGRIVASKYALVVPGEDGETKAPTERCGIFGLAVRQGTMEEARDRLIGFHNERVRLLIDEAQSTYEAAFEARSNLKAGAFRGFKFVAAGNPDNQLDPLCRHSEPLKGWDSIDPDRDTEWETKEGVCLFFDGRKNPGVTDPDLCPFALHKEDIEETARLHGRDSKVYWQMRVGFVAPEGTTDSIISESMLMRQKVQDPVIWQPGLRVVAGLDPAFSNGGDRCILSPALYGFATTGARMVSFLPRIHIQFKARGGDPIAYQILDRVRDECKRLGIAPGDLAVDATGTQSSLADILDHEWASKEGQKVHRVLFGGAASMLRVSREDSTPCAERFGNRATELWMALADLVRCGQIRGLDDESCREFAARRVKRRAPRSFIETKDEYKERSGNVSPDDIDSKACCVDLLRHRLGLLASVADVAVVPVDVDRAVRALDIDAETVAVSAPG